MMEACSSNWLERRTPNPEGVGSNPSRPASDMRINSFRRGMGNTCSPWFEGGKQRAGRALRGGSAPFLESKARGVGSNPSRPANCGLEKEIKSE